MKLLGLLAVLLAACSHSREPTILPTPAGATDVEHLVLKEIGAFQTHFVLDVAYPSVTVLEHYQRTIADPWVQCANRRDGWSRYIDAAGVDSRGRTQRTVHKRSHTWVNLQAERMLLLSLRYTSDPSDSGPPDNTMQQAILVEYFDQDIKSEVERLGLTCPKEVTSAL
jgi:hypothetical protein